MGESVTGGAGAIQTCLEDLMAFAQLVDAAAETAAGVDDQVKFARSQVGGCGWDLGPNHHHLDDILTGLTGPTSATHRAFDELHLLATLVRAAAEQYDDTDSGILHMLVSAIAELPGAVLKAGQSLISDPNPIPALQQFVTADPELLELLMFDTRVRVGAVAPMIPDGHPVVTDSGGGLVEVAPAPPNAVSDLVSELAETNRAAAGEISVSFVFSGGATRRVIVDIPGTKSWSVLPTNNVTSLATNLRGVNGATTSYETGVLQAMRDAGVTSTDDVMLVGHSQGGMIAVNAARDATRSGDFHISHVVTAGAPIGHAAASLPRSVQVLALEGRGDVVPRLDGAPNPSRPNLTTVTGGPNHGSLSDNHSLDDTYLPLARSVDASDNESIRAFVDSANGFFHQDLMLTERYTITRGY